MMKATLSAGLTAVVLLLFLSGCDFVSKEEAVGNPRLPVLWSTAVGGGSVQQVILEDGVLYYADVFGHRVLALDPQDGTIIWTTELVPEKAQNYSLISHPLVLGDDIFIAMKYDEDREAELQWLKRDGTHIGRIRLPSGLYGMTITLSRSETQVLTIALRKRLVGIDPADFIQDDNDDTLYHVQPRLYNPGAESLGGANPVYHDGVIYAGMGYRITPGSTDRAVEFFAVQEDSGEVLWTWEPQFLFGSVYALEPYRVIGDHLFILDNFGYALVNRHTGEPLYESRRGGAKSHGALFHDGIAYWANNITSHDFDKFENSNILAVDMMTGEPVWEREDYELYVSGVPILDSGVLYYSSQNGIHLYNAENGTYFGGDRRRRGDVWQINQPVHYENKMFYYNQGTIYAVELPYKIGRRGNLVLK